MTLGDVPQPLLDDIAEGRCLPFIGAGFSLNADFDRGLRMLDWAQLAAHLADLAGVSTSLEGPEAAAAYERRFGRVQLVDTIRRSLHPDKVRPGRAHTSFVQLPFDTIYTTNFDLLLEEALRQISKPFRSLVGELQLPFHAGFFTTNVVKMHGDIRHEEHIIVTKRDYEEFLARYPVVATHLSAMLITRTALFIGYSRTDSDFQHVQNVVKSRLGQFQRMPYLIQFDTLPRDIDAALDDGLHIINLRTDTGISRAEALSEFFESVQVELDSRAGKELRAAEPNAFEEVAHETLDATYVASDAGDLLEGSSNLCFVMMPFAPDTEPVYDQLIRPAATTVGLVALRADEMHMPGLVTEQIRAAIRESRVCIAEISDENANVLYELGLAQALGKPVLLLARVGTRVPFGIAALQYIAYDSHNPETALATVEVSLQGLLEMGKLEEAEALIANGMHRAGVAVLSVMMEHTLTRILSDFTDGGRSHRQESLGGLVRQLLELGQVDEAKAAGLRRFTEIRNRAIHQLDELSKRDAELSLALAKDFLRNA